MATIIAQPNQSMQDIVLMACGTLEGAMSFCRANGVSISDEPVVGLEYIIPADIPTDINALNYLNKKGIVIGTLAKEPEPPTTLGVTVVLKPDLTLDAKPSTNIKLEGNLNFINTNALVAWPTLSRTLLFEEESVVGSGGVVPSYVESLGLPPASKIMKWAIPYALTSDLYVGKFYLAGEYSMTWEDAAHNTAIYAPMLLVNHAYDSEQLLSDIAITVVSSSPTSITVKLTRSHPSITLGSIGVSYWDWIGDATGGADVPGDDNSTLLTLTAGTYKFGVVTRYYDSVNEWDFGYSSKREMVISVG